MAFLKWPNLDPNEVLDFEIDWGKKRRLEEGEEILTSDWTVAEGTVEILTGNPHQPLIVDGDGGANTVTRVWLTGGALDETCLVNNHITTTANRERDLTGKLKIKAK